MSLDQNKTYLVWNGTTFPNSPHSKFKAPAGSIIDWGDGTIETFNTVSTTVNTHTYTDEKATHTIIISGLTSIDNFAFMSCEGLTSIIIGNNITSIGESAFQYCKSLKSANIPNSVTTIKNAAFNSCDELTSIIIPNSVNNIGWYTFEYCYNLTSVILSNNIISLKGQVFKDCRNLTSITIPDGVEKIEDSAFIGCIRLKTIVLFSVTPPTLASNAIPSVVSTIYVPQSSKETYQKATNWTEFASKIVSDNLYLSFVRFNQKNKEYIRDQIYNILIP